MSVMITAAEKVGMGVDGLDHILFGGLQKNMVYLVHGGPGTGKTTLGFHFLREGVRQGERVLYASLLQTRSELETILISHDWSLEGIDLLELPENIRRTSMEEQTLFNTADIELHEVHTTIVEAIEKHKPQRLVFDSITELGILVDSPYQLRRQMLKLKQQVNRLGCTTLFTASESNSVDLESLQTVVHGVIELGIQRPNYGEPRRWLDPTKMRGMDFLGGRHDFRILTGGIEVYPRIEVSHVERQAKWRTISSGNPELDALFGGGLEEGTACLFNGTTGAGKSTLAGMYADAAAKRGDRSVIFCFDERRQTFLRRASGLGMGIEGHIEQGLIDLRQVNVGELTPGEFAFQVRHAAEEKDLKIVVIDSLSGYFNAMPEQRQLMVQLHELLSYLNGAGVLTLLVVATHGFADHAEVDIDASYIADTVVMMRNFEAGGMIRRCISVLKKRYGDHEKTIREIRIDKNGVRVGEPLRHFRNVLSGYPEFVGDTQSLMNSGENGESTGYSF
ncbi:MAG: ATPase domain-containing protein [Desulfococcaceae bacterium]